MISRISRDLRRHESGFTLIELLVVVVILGILSAVVVFAVRGIGDKGRSAALGIDARTLRTAEEAYCAKAGKYGTQDQLLGIDPADPNDPNSKYKFLSQASTSYSVSATKPTAPQPPGPCNGWRYDLTEIRASAPPIRPPSCGEADGWCATPPPVIAYSGVYNPNTHSIVQLPNGKVLAFGLWTAGAIPTELYDPAGGPYGTWSAGPPVPAPAPTPHFDTAVLITGGKVLAHFGGDFFGELTSFWKVYDPSAPVGQWTDTGRATYLHQNYVAAVQLPPCRQGEQGDCGKVLIVGGPSDPPTAELYDPATNTFTTGNSWGQAGSNQSDPALTLTKNGKVLLVADDISELFDPVTGKFDDAATPIIYMEGTVNPLVVAPDGDVLEINRPGFTAGVAEGAAAIYHPYQSAGGHHPGETRPGGFWTSAPTCGRGINPDSGCYILGSLPDGTVVANGNANYQDRAANGSKEIFLFNPVTKVWRPGASMNSAYTPGDGVLLTGVGCGDQCGKLLVVGNGSAELYKPPMP